MTSSGKVRIYELSKDLGLENKDVLDAAEKLSIAAKSHSSSISDDEAGRIRSMLGKGSRAASASSAKPAGGKAILSVKKAEAPAAPKPSCWPVKPAPAAKPKPPNPHCGQTARTPPAAPAKRRRRTIPARHEQTSGRGQTEQPRPQPTSVDKAATPKPSGQAGGKTRGQAGGQW